MTPLSLLLSGAAAAALLLTNGCSQQAGNELHPLLAPEAAVTSVTEPHELHRMHEEAKKAAPLAGEVATF